MSSKLRPAVTVVCLLGSPALYGGEDATGTTQADADSGAPAELTQPNAEAQDGYRMGSFSVRPEVTVSGVYDSNIFAAPTDEVEDSIMLFAPALGADSTWTRHALEFDLGDEVTMTLVSVPAGEFSVGSASRPSSKPALLALLWARSIPTQGSPDGEWRNCARRASR